MSAPKLSVVIITKNEEQNIIDCVRSVSWADEIIVVDSNSADNTVKRAEQEGAVTHQIEWQGFGHAKQTAVNYATGEWILSLDADERITPDLAKEIKHILKSSQNTQCDCYKIPRLTNFVGAWIHHSGWRPDFVLRLFRKTHGKFSEATVHETVISSGTVGQLKNDILHYSYKSIEDYLERLNRYTTLAAQEMSNSGMRFRLWRPLIKPPAIFIKRYILKLGVLDGWAGFQIAFLSSVYVFVKYAKLWRLSHQKTIDQQSASDGANQ